jgi:hypothetical protein
MLNYNKLEINFSIIVARSVHLIGCTYKRNWITTPNKVGFQFRIQSRHQEIDE